MSKSKEYIEGFKAALQAYSWTDNAKQLRIGIPGILLKDAISKIESEEEIEIAPIPAVPFMVSHEEPIKEEPLKEDK